MSYPPSENDPYAVDPNAPSPFYSPPAQPSYSPPAEPAPAAHTPEPPAYTPEPPAYTPEPPAYTPEPTPTPAVEPATEPFPAPPPASAPPVSPSAPAPVYPPASAPVYPPMSAPPGYPMSAPPGYPMSAPPGYPMSAPPGYPMSAPPAAYIPAGYPQPGAAVATSRPKSTIIFAALAAIFLVATAALTVLFVTDHKKIADQGKQLTSTSADLKTKSDALVATQKDLDKAKDDAADAARQASSDVACAKVARLIAKAFLADDNNAFLASFSSFLTSCR